MNRELEQKNCIARDVERMISLLKVSNQNQWATALYSILQEQSNLQDLKRAILSLYGGMGSLNDLILYANGQMDPIANDEFDSLRTKVFDTCIS